MSYDAGVKKKLNVKEWMGAIVIIVLFVVSAYLSQAYQEELGMLLEGKELIGQITYFFLSFISVVAAPVNALFLLPVAAVLWGPVLAALLSIAGWTIGGVVAYYIAQRWGKPVVGRFVNTEKIEKIAAVIPERNLFIWLVLARMSMSVDILSYALGLLVKIRYSTYTLSLLIGVTPWAFLLAYSATLPPIFMAGTIAVAVVVMGSALWFIRRAYKKVSVEEDSQKQSLTSSE